MKAAHLILVAGLTVLTVGCEDNSVQPQLSPSVDLSPATISLMPGGKQIVTMNVGNMKNFFAASFNLVFESRIIEVIDVTVPPDCVLGYNSSISFFEEIPGGVSIGIGRMQADGDSNVSGSGTLLNITVKAHAKGTTAINFENIRILDESGNNAIDTTQLEAHSANVTVR